jgi:hypothetical protein
LLGEREWKKEYCGEGEIPPWTIELEPIRDLTVPLLK